MRFLRILALAAGGFVLGSCADDGGGASVNADISWYVDCAQGSSGCGSGRTYHDMTIAPKKPFAVKCKRVGSDIIEFKITDPGADDDPKTPINELHPGSEIEVSNGSAARRTCDVTVRDFATREAAAPLTFFGKCAGSAVDGGCTLTGEFDKDGWVWVGQLHCPKLELRNASATAVYTLEHGKVQDTPVNISVDNCD
jgi:hypothetical protein